jgi:UrcA family protein
MSTSSHLLAALLAAAAAAITFATPVVAAPPAAETRVVSYADLDLAAAAGRARLDQRLRTAVREVCGTASSADLIGRREVATCRVETLAAAYAQRPAGEVLVAQASAAGVEFR